MELPGSGPRPVQYPRAGAISFTLDGAPMPLAVYWIDVYGGGLFLPFRDAMSGTETYGAGRYLFDTVKGNDFLRLDGDAETALGYAGGGVLLDFNYAYNPSKETQTADRPPLLAPIPSVPDQHRACFGQ